MDELSKPALTEEEEEEEEKEVQHGDDSIGAHRTCLTKCEAYLHAVHSSSSRYTDMNKLKSASS